jgi:hypothetical protein
MAIGSPCFRSRSILDHRRRDSRTQEGGDGAAAPHDAEDAHTVAVDDSSVVLAQEDAHDRCAQAPTSVQAWPSWCGLSSPLKK